MTVLLSPLIVSPNATFDNGLTLANERCPKGMMEISCCSAQLNLHVQRVLSVRFDTREQNVELLTCICYCSFMNRFIETLGDITFAHSLDAAEL